MVTKKRKKRVSKPKQIIEIEVNEDGKELVCPKCQGRGFIERNGGLVQIQCDCGAVSVGERIGVITRIGEVDRSNIRQDTVQSELTEEPETKEPTQEGDAEIFSEPGEGVSVSESRENI